MKVRVLLPFVLFALIALVYLTTNETSPPPRSFDSIEDSSSSSSSSQRPHIPHQLITYEESRREYEAMLQREKQMLQPTMEPQSEEIVNKTITNLVQENRRDLKTPFIFDFKDGVTADSEFIVEGVFLGTELILELQDVKGQIPFHASFRPESNSVLFDSMQARWEKQEVLKQQPLQPGEKFKFALSLSPEGYRLKLNDEDLYFFVSREKIPVEELARFSVWCRKENCVEIARVQALNIPVITRKAAERKLPEGGHDRPVLFIGIMTKPENSIRRDSLRQSWFQDSAIRSGKVQARFFVGRSNNQAQDKCVKEEAESEGDIVLIDFEEGYYGIANKTLEIMRHASTAVRPDFVMKCDDDTYVRVDRVLDLLKDEQPSNLYMGLISKNGVPNRDLGSKWYMPPEMFPRPKYPPFAHGPGYILSRDLAEFVVSENDLGHLTTISLEDVGMGDWIDHGVREHRLPVKMVDNRFFLTGGCRQEAVIGHYISPLTMQCMWKKYARGDRNFCC